MKLRILGNSSLRVSEISLGSWLSVGGKHLTNEIPGSPSVLERETGLKILEKAVDCGINFFDTAPGYGKGNAERMIGEFMQDYNRDEFIIATKVFFPVEWSDTHFGTSRKSIHINLKDSLERLQTDYVDIYYCHVYDNYGNIEETIRAMNTMIDQGKILYWAASNWSAAEIERVYGICRAEGLQPPIALQTKYNLLDREIELSHMSTIDYTKIGLASYSPLQEGILTGKYNHERPSDSRLEKLKGTVFEEISNEFFDKMLTEDNLTKLRKLEELAKDQEISMAQLSLAWLLSKRFVSTAIVGASKGEHLEDNTQVSSLNLDKDVFARIEEIMNNEPEYQGEHKRWTYNEVSKSLKERDYRINSISHNMRQKRKEDSS
jgi:aryl-alcohol dehydrogenase-like predicted oxidoreductase